MLQAFSAIILLLLSFISLCFASTKIAVAAEVDQFTRFNDVELKDSASLLNNEVQQRINRALVRANRNPPHLKPRKIQRVPKLSECSVSRLYESFEVLLARPIVGQVESFAEQSPDISRRIIPLNESVYRLFTWPQSPSLVLSERVASVVRVGDFEVGSDKFGHFFTEGYSYFEETNHLELPINQALLFGEWTESVYFGAQTTGVYSYADLAANFHGLRFWNRILATHPDPLAQNTNQSHNQNSTEPYIRCDNKRWVVNQPFKWGDYIDNAWNESMNCSLFRTLSLLGQVLEEGPHCNSEQLPWSRYGEFGFRLLNQHGLGVMPDYLQPEVLLRQMSPDYYDSGTMARIKSFREGLERWRLRRELKNEGKQAEHFTPQQAQEQSGE